MLRFFAALFAIVATVTPAFAADLLEVRVTPVSETLTIADTRSYRATAIYSDDTSADVTALAIWSSLDSGVASVDAAGNVTAHAFGDTTLSATYAGTTGTGTVRVRGVDAHLFTSSWANSGQVMAFRADLIGGGLTANGVQPTQSAPWGVATDPSGRFVYVANRESASVSAFAADATTGVLTPLGTYPTGGPWPRVPVVEPRGRFLYVANLGQGGVPSISGYAIAADGTLTPVPGSPFIVPGATMLATHPSGEFLYVATGADNRIGGYRIGVNGALTALPGSPYWFDAFQAFANLGDMVVHRSGRFLFSTSNGTSIRVFGIDPATGVLTGQLSRYFQDHLQRPLIAHPNGRHLFTTAWEGVVGLAFDEATATLSQVAGSPFASSLTQYSIALDPGGHYLYGVLGDQGGPSLEAFRTISVHQVNPLTGAVVRIATYDTAGSLLLGVAITASDAPGPSLTQIDVQPADSTVETTLFGITRTFTAVGTYSDGRSGPLPGASFTSSDPSVASIDPVTGVATLHAYGTTTITAQRSGVSGSTSFTVAVAPLVGLQVTPIAVTIAPGESRQFHATAVYGDNVTLDVTSSAIWAPLAPAVASVTAGLATGLAGGTTTVNATFGGLTASAQLSVRTAKIAAFVVDRQASRLRGYTRTAGSAALTGINGLPLNVSSPEAVAIDPRGRVLYVAETATDRILSFHVDGVTAELVPAPGSPTATRPQPSHLAIDPAGRFLYAIHRGDFRVSAFAIDANGGLTPAIVDVPLTMIGRSLTVDASGRFVYIGMGQGDGNDRLRAYRIDGVSGGLTFIGDYVTGRFPVDVQSDSAGRFLYVANPGDSRVSTYTIHPSTGALTQVSTVNTGLSPQRLSFHPSAGVLYATAQSPSRVLSFLVNSVTGALTPVADVPLLGVVNNLAVEPSGAYLYIADERFAQYAIDTLGNITFSNAYDVPTTPVDIAIGVLAADTGAALTSVAVVPSSLIVYGNAPGQTRKLSALGTYSTGAQAFLTSSVTWSSSDPTAVSIADDGTATVLTVPSTVTLTATLGAVSGTAAFVASNAAVRIAVMPASETATVGNIGTYRATAIYPDDSAEDVTHLTTWASLDPSVASVDAAGAATAVAYGDATITATVAGVTGNAILRVRGIDNYLFTTRWSSPNEVAAYKADSISGDLAANGAQPTEGAPWGVAVDPSGRWVYVANRSSASVSALAVDAATGTLAPIGTYPSGGPWPRVPVVEPRGRFLYVANLGEGGAPSIAGYAIGADGTLTPVPGSPFAVPGATTLAAHPSGEFLYVATGADNRIGGYRIGLNGALTALPGSPYWFDAFQAFANLGDMVVHRSGRFLFSTSNGTSIRVFGIDPATGVLTGQLSRYFQDHLQRPLIAHPNGRHLFTTAWEGIVGLAFDEATATLSQIAGSPFESSFTQHSIALDPGGEHLYGVLGDQGGSLEAMRTLSIHRVDPLTGHVTRTSTLNAGALMLGIAVVAADAPGPALTQITVQPTDSTTETTVFPITRSFTALGSYADGRSGPLSGVRWSSSDPSIATIDQLTGIATIHAYGTTTITAERSGVIGNTSFTVVEAPLVALYVTPFNAQATPGTARQFIATGVYRDGINKDLTSVAVWTSSVPAVATVAGGIALGVSPGISTISAIVPGFTASAQFAVQSTKVVAYVADVIGLRAYGYTRAANVAALASISGSPYAGFNPAGPQSVVLDPRGRLLFAADTSGNRIIVSQVDGITGQLIAAPGSPVATRTSPTQLAIDPAGRFLYALHQGQLRVSAFAIDPASGRLTSAAVDTNLAFEGRSLTVDARGRFLFVGSGPGNDSDVIRTYQIDQTTGALTAVGDYSGGRLPLGLASDPAGNYLYVAAGGDNAIVTLGIHPLTGALTRLSSAAVNFPNRIAFHPTGNALYVTSQAPSRLVSFLVNPVTGALSTGANATLFGGVNSVAVEPTGGYVYVAAERLNLFATDSSGQLVPVQDYDAGSRPFSVTVASLGADSGATLTSLDVTPSSLTVYASGPGATRQLTAVGTYDDGTQAFLTLSVNWSSSDNLAVSISTSGVASVLAVPASVTLTASFGSVSDTATLVTSNVAARVIVLPASETTTAGTVRPFRATAIYPDQSSEDVTAAATWSSLDSSIAAIDSTGAATATVVGDTTLSASFGGATGTAELHVRGADSHLYASSWGFTNELRAFRADALGAVTANGGRPTEVGPWGVAIDPTGRWIYVANRESNSVSAFAVSPGIGGSIPIGTYPTGGPWPRVPVVEPRGRFLYVANLGHLGTPSIAGFAIAADGSLTPVPGSPFVVPGAVTITAHPSGDFLYVTTGSDHRIGAYRIADDGALTAIAGSPFWFDDFGPVNNLMDLVVHRSGRFLFSSDNGTSIRVFSLDPATGALTGQVSRYFQDHLQRPLIAHPNGRHLYATAWEGIVGLAFDEAAGTLSALAGSPFASSHSQYTIALDPAAQYLYGVNGEQSGNSLEAMRTISVHRVDGVTGQVTRINTLDTGTLLMGLAVIAAPPPDNTPPPPPTIDSFPANPSRPSTSSVVFTFSNTEAHVTFECRLLPLAFSPCTSPATYVGLMPGTRTFAVRAVDSSNNRSDAATYTWTIDSPYVPAFSNLTPSQSIPRGAPSIFVSGTLSAPGPVYPETGEAVAITVGSQTIFTVLNAVGQFEATIDTSGFAATPPGSPHVILYEYSGSADFTSALDTSTTLTVVGDTTAPVIVPVISGTLGNGGWYVTDVFVNWTVTDPESAVSTFGCEPTAIYWDTDAAGIPLTCMAWSEGGSASETAMILRDATPPTVEYYGNLGTYAFNGTVAIGCAPWDPMPGSGIASTTCADIVGPASSFGVGTHTFDATVTDAAGNVGGGSTTFDVLPPPDTTAPVIVPVITGTLGSGGWYRSDVMVSFTVTDPESAVTTSGCEPVTISSDTSATGVSITCSATSEGGTTSETVVIKRDATVPSVVYTGNLGTYTFDSLVNITCTASDPAPGSGVASTTCANISGPASSFGVGTHTFDATVTDAAGNVGGGSTTFTVLEPPDTTAPVIVPVITGTLGSGGWYRSDVMVSFTVTDPESAVTTSGCEPVTISSDTSATGVSITCSATSEGGTTSETVVIKRDATAPSVVYTGNLGTYAFDSLVNITCTASDPAPGSGVASTTCANISGPASSFGVGSHTFSATATDNAGGIGSATTSFLVTAAPPNPDLCALTQQYVRGSAKYLAMKPNQKNAVENHMNALCRHLEKSLITPYQSGVKALLNQDLLTALQAATLHDQAEALR